MIDLNRGKFAMNRRAALKRTGLLSVSAMMPAVWQSENSHRAVAKSQPEKTDILVVGGGTAGVIAALQSARAGCKTILIENGSLLGGTMTTGGVCFPGLFHAWGKQIIAGIGWEIVTETVQMNDDVMPDFTVSYGTSHPKHQILVNASLYALLAEEKCIQAGVDIRYYETPTDIEPANGGWNVVIAGKATRYIIQARQIVDCTGNALTTALAGYDRVRTDETQPGSLIFELGGYDYASLDSQTLKMRYDEAVADGSLLRTDAYHGVMGLLNIKKGLATQHILNADSSTSRLHTQANIQGRTSLLRILRFVRTLPGCEKAYIRSMQPETGIRETYRIKGLYEITHEDYIEGRMFDDSLSYSFYPIDMHVAHGVQPKHLKEGVVPTVPLRALIPEGSENFIVAGRCVSSDRLANSAIRVQASCMGMGQAAGAAAALAVKNNTTPMKVPVGKIKKLISEHGGIVPN